ncbi:MULTISPECIES: DUF461 domain-containing protein [unclassified Streptomyces]|uniref:DUF461 domain-containing protein n=1 Tax=unclassified Streptomyces TaxID=2593676 RepID=UPI0013702057|nr:DUF461 domain-containing protein [Streptomyces sp. SID2563]
MSRSLRHGALAATAIAFSITALTACGAGNNAQTLEVRPDNASTRSGDIKIQNANVITQPEREAKGPAVVTATLFNNGSQAETLESITLKGGSGTVQLHPAEGSGPVVVPAGGRVILGGQGNASAVIENGDEATENGNVQPLVFKLSRSGDISLAASVVPAKHYFKGFGPSALPEPSQTPDASPSGSPSGSASPDASGSPSGEASASSSASESGQPG